jgi:hypothetical protein
MLINYSINSQEAEIQARMMARSHSSLSSIYDDRTPSPSRIDTLRLLVDLQPLLRHLSITQEVEGHPHEMSPDSTELLLDLVDRHVLRADVEMALLVLFVDLGIRSEFLAVLKDFDCTKYCQ